MYASYERSDDSIAYLYVCVPYVYAFYVCLICMPYMSSLMIAAVSHDLEHPGVNNQFLVNSQSSLATLYNNKSILEKHHAFRAFELMLHPGIDLLAVFSKEEYDAFRHQVMSLILATDLAQHNDFVASLSALPSAEDGGAPDMDGQLFMETMLKGADFGDVLKPFAVHKKWVVRMTDEFFLQGDMERASGIRVSPMCDRTSQCRVAVIKGLIDYLILPFCSHLARVLPHLCEVAEQVASNRSAWDSYDDPLLLHEVGKRTLGTGERRPVRVASWNIAAVNNNPFEYWVTHGQTSQSEGYAKLMTDVQVMIDSPEEHDFKVADIITDDMVQELVELLTEHENGAQEGADKLLHVWETEYKNRYAIEGFLKDKAIGRKRLISMPDRISNTIQSQGEMLMRPSVISMFNDEALSSIPGWWCLWTKYMFETQVKVLDRNSPNTFRFLRVIDMMQKIPHAKYPAISEEEEAMSIPLQLLAMAIFDGVLLHILNTVAPQTWQPIKLSLCEAFNQNKGAKVISILERAYADTDVIFIQEAAAAFVEAAKARLGRQYLIMRPYLMDGFRNQNSIVLAKRGYFEEGSTIDVTDHIIRLAGVSYTCILQCTHTHTHTHTHTRTHTFSHSRT